MRKLRDRMLVDLQLCGAKPKTQRNYLREAESLAKYFNRSPAELGEDELKEYLLYRRCCLTTFMTAFRTKVATMPLAHLFYNKIKTRKVD